MSHYVPDRPGPDRSLRRRTDRLLTVVGWVVVALAVLTVVSAGVAAASAYRDGRGPSRPVRVSYVDQAGRARVGQVSVTGLAAGTSVRIQVDGDGRVGTEPPTRGDAVFSAVSAGVAVVLLGVVLLGMAWYGARCAVTARNHAAWERQWRLVEPQWSGRGTAAP